MKAALIPPRGYELSALESDIHLVLPLPACTTNPRYTETYRNARARGDYVILDNGCAEGTLVKGKTLMKFAEKLQVHEIVAPDVMGDGPGTLKATAEWLLEWPEASSYSIMGVVQGADDNDRCVTLDSFSRMEAITTLGIPKVYIDRPKSDARLKMVEHVLKYYPGRFKIHLLGLNGLFPTEIKDIQYPPEVRSMDSTQPYKLAMVGRSMTIKQAWAKRPDGYFETERYIHQPTLKYNIGQFLRWAVLNGV